ncbi:hypothetical protein [Glycomyces terrestris]|uniref:DUF4185 domain-containing protein n=1 Tax=Glycomyces terrestris TaxID=2493553 RepID=A0A426UXS9_9ACTN|nr:hypothetical protein [Glycomyces terrestris]RRR99374.1 hypothetical protein EIW28_11710 [Glycomyces terrestris]
MSSTARQRLAVIASGVLSALIAGIPSFAQESGDAAPVLDFAAATCGAAGDLEAEFLLTEPLDAPAGDAWTVADVRVEAASGPLPATAVSGTLLPGAEVPAPGEGSLSGTAPVPASGGRVAFAADLERGGEQTTVEGSAVLEPCGPAVPDEELEVPGRVWGPYGGKRTIPTHVSPAGGQTTHPSVLHFPDGWNGYEFWMAHTPYPGSNSAHEDPNIAASHDGVNWVVPAGLSNPIDDQPGLPGPYNSDTDLAMGPGNTMYVFWRVVIPELTQERIKYATSTDGVNWSAPAEALRSSMKVRRPLSPAFLYEDGRWVMWAVNITRSPNRVEYTVGGATPAKADWGTPVAVAVGGMQREKEPWHLSVHKDGDEYIGLLNDTVIGSTGRDGDLLFLAGETPTAFANSAKSTVPRTKPFQHDHLYRATMIVSSEYGRPGYRMWYSARLALNPDVWNVQDTFLHGAAVHGAP